MSQQQHVFWQRKSTAPENTKDFKLYKDKFWVKNEINNHRMSWLEETKRSNVISSRLRGMLEDPR